MKALLVFIIKDIGGFANYFYNIELPDNYLHKIRTGYLMATRS